ncbi:MAG: P1 family peptidase, partial [Verrucomicrobiota bacterium]|nr:P1 family peptidase [Verrucomicrobiota bacterium]
GDLFLAFSTANPNVADPAAATHAVQTVPNDRMDALFTATVQSVEEAIVNALVDNQSMTGRDGHHVDALPRERLRELLTKYNRVR